MTTETNVLMAQRCNSIATCRVCWRPRARDWWVEPWPNFIAAPVAIVRVCGACRAVEAQHA